MEETKSTEGIQVNGDSVTVPASILFINTNAIVSALNRINEAMLPLPVSYRIQKLIKAMQVEYKEIDKLRLDLFKLHGKETAPGTYSLEGDEDAQMKFTRDFDEMIGDRKPSFNIVTMSISDPSTYGQNAVFAPKDLSILIDLSLLKIVE